MPRRLPLVVIALSGIALIALLTDRSAAKEQPASVLQFSGMCDASAAVAIGNDLMLVADDERNVFCLYRIDRPGPPLDVLAWDKHLGINPQTDEHPEADVEAAAVLDGRIYWIASHGRNKDGKWRSNRHQFFAMTVSRAGEQVHAAPYRKPYTDLATRLAADERLQRLGLDEALGSPGRAADELAPKDAGLNIEGLSASADGRSLLIGLRNPRPDGRAILVPLRNPAEVVADAATPEFGDPILLELPGPTPRSSDRLGIRSLEYSPQLHAYLIIAGPHDEGDGFALYRWSGGKDDRPELLPDATAAIAAVRRFTPEALLVRPNGSILVLSDDGALRVKVQTPAECAKGAFDNGQCEAKSLLDHRRKTFHALVLPLK